MWADKPLILEDEDEAALIASFVELSARYPDRDSFEIAAHVFRNLFDPLLRSQQAALCWSRDLDIQERIRKAKSNGNVEEEYTKEKWHAETLAIVRDERLGPQAKKATLDGLRLIGEANGWIIKAIDKKITDGTKRELPRFVIAQYPDE